LRGYPQARPLAVAADESALHKAADSPIGRADQDRRRHERNRLTPCPTRPARRADETCGCQSVSSAPSASRRRPRTWSSRRLPQLRWPRGRHPGNTRPAR